MQTPGESSTHPTVSVILITYNRAYLLPKAIEGVLQQTYTNFEFIIVDDGSTDNTADLVAQYSDPRIVYKPVEHGERARARNIGIQISHGQYISFLDSDDWYLPEKLAEQIMVLEANPEAGMTLGGWIIVNENGQKIDEIRPWESLSPQLTAEDWMFRGNATPITILVRRCWFDKVDGFDSDLIISEDTDMWIRLTLAGCQNVWTKKSIAVVLAHSSNSLRNWSAVKNSRMNFLDKSFTRPEFIANLRMSKEQVYARFHVVLAWQAFASGFFKEGQQELILAIEKYPVLLEQKAEILFHALLDYSQFFLVNDPIKFLHFTFQHLPSELASLAKRRNDLLGKNCMSRAWKSKREGNFKVMRESTLKAIFYTPGCIRDRGILSMLLQSILGQRLWLVMHPDIKSARN